MLDTRGNTSGPAVTAALQLRNDPSRIRVTPIGTELLHSARRVVIGGRGKWSMGVGPFVDVDLECKNQVRVGNFGRFCRPQAQTFKGEEVAAFVDGVVAAIEADKAVRGTLRKTVPLLLEGLVYTLVGEARAEYRPIGKGTGPRS
jgi:hypothetical protein